MSIALRAAGLIVGLWPPSATPPVRTAPALEPSVAALSLPPSLEDRLIYYNSFDDGDPEPDLDRTGAQLVASPDLGPDGMRGGCAYPADNRVLELRGETLSPHRPLTVTFWWSLCEDERIDGTFGLFHLTNGKGMISHFSRGRGEWCALERPVGILQVYYLDEIQNVNGIYDRDLMAHHDLRAGVWHHTAIVVRGASLVEAYTDGALAWETRNKGRPFSADDQLHDLTIGSRWAIPVAFDELMIFSRALSAEEIGEYVKAVRQMVQVGYPSR